MKSNKLHLWESALLIAFAVTLLIGCCASAGQAALAGEVLRLHVVANSDSPEDQAVKLQVRDAVLARAQPLLEGVNIGGLGTPIASLASLITLKQYLRVPEAKAGRFLLVFTLVNLAGLVILLTASYFL